MTTITLEPTAEFDGSLRSAIVDTLASGTPATVLLQSSNDGTLRHFTTPGRGNIIEVGPGGLRLLGVASAGGTRPTIERPRDSIGPTQMDGNYGLYFIPSPPTADEQANIDWKQYLDPEGDTEKNFEFGIIIRGAVTIRGLIFDCNMGLQENIPADVQANQIEHSAMIGFRGHGYTVSQSDEPKRKVFIGFERVTVEDCLFIHGGHSDELLIDRGYFHPNIERVTFHNIEARDRVNFKRASIDFTGLARLIIMNNLDVESIRLEPTGATRQYPRKEAIFRRCEMVATSIKAVRVSLGAKNDACRLIGSNWDVTEKFSITELRGTLRESVVVPSPGQDSRMIGMHNFLFDQVEWRFKPNGEGLISGLRPMSDDGDPCSVRFFDNNFVVDASGEAGVLTGVIFSSAGFEHSAGEVTLRAEGCTYPNEFGHSADRPIADIRAKGNWRFARADFGGRPIETAVKFNPERGTMTVTDELVRVVVGP